MSFVKPISVGIMFLCGSLGLMFALTYLVIWTGREHGHLSCFSNGVKTFDADVELWSSSKGTMHLKHNGIWGTTQGELHFHWKTMTRDQNERIKALCFKLDDEINALELGTERDQMKGALSLLMIFGVSAASKIAGAYRSPRELVEAFLADAQAHEMAPKV